MTISQMQLDQALSELEIDKFWLGYFQEGFREDAHQQLLEHYEMLKKDSGLTRADLARKIGRRPEQVTRWLAAPTNLETDTISDLGLAMGLVPKLRFEPVGNIFAADKPNQGNAVSDFVARAETVTRIRLFPSNNNAVYEVQDQAVSS